MKNNIELVPVIIQDLVSYMLDPSRSINERQNLSLKIETIKEICEEALQKHQINVATSAMSYSRTLKVSRNIKKK